MKTTSYITFKRRQLTFSIQRFSPIILFNKIGFNFDADEQFFSE